MIIFKCFCDEILNIIIKNHKQNLKKSNFSILGHSRKDRFGEEEDS